MKYPESFKEKVKKVFPTFYGMHKVMEEGSEFLGRYLDDNVKNSISNDVVLEAESLEELKAMALANKETEEIYREWTALYRKERGFANA